MWTDDGKPADLTLLGLDQTLAARVKAWNAAYEENKVPIDGTGDEAWLAEGRRLLHDVRTVLSADYRVVVTEPWWGEDPA